MFKKFLKTFNTLITKDVGKNNQSSRDKWIKEKLSEIPSGSKILDAGAGDQRFKEYCQHLNYVSQDIALYDGEGDGKGIHVNKDFNSLDITSDIISIPVENESFDAIMCIEVLEHVVDPVKAMKELDRILKKNGTLIITTPFNSLTHYAPYHYSTGFSSYFYEYYMEKFDYSILELKKNGNYFEYLAQEIRRLEQVSKKYSLKVNKIFKFFEYVYLNRLNKLSKNNESSEELLCFGLFLKAKKN